MKRLSLSVLFFSMVLIVNAHAYTWNEAKNQWGYFGMDEWKEKGVDTYEEAKGWHDIGVTQPGYKLQRLKELGLTVSTTKGFKESCHNTVRGYEPDCIEQYLGLGLSSHEIKEWEKVVRNPRRVKEWIELGIKDINTVKDWIKVTKFTDARYAEGWIEAGVNNPKEAKKWDDIGVSNNSIKEIKDAKLDIDDVEEWLENKIRIDDIAKLASAGFDDYDDYEDFKNIKIDHAVKLKKWDIDPDKLIESMSYSNKIFGQELYFSSKDTFEKAYDAIEDNCDEIVRDKWFSGIDMNENEDKCYVFAGKMIQRLDEKSFFGKGTQNGLVNGMSRRNFYAENFQGSWMENKNKIGIIKGDGSYSYNSKNGKKLVPKGTVIFSK
ncbi:MAG: hypothetical protein U9N30_05550 [Campylobacterota bacterium]|nr:hypothetical protein [Campylobacterota bacterium]